jgi:hypothetical protein
MKCYECGSDVTNGARFCRTCGAQCDSTPAVETQVLQPSSPTFAPLPYQPSIPPASMQPIPSQPMSQSYPAYPSQQQPYYPQQQQMPGYPQQQQYPGYAPQQAMPGYQHQPVNVNIYNTNQQAPMAPLVSMVPVVVAQQKSVGLALLLTFFFGPFGMFYSTIGGAVAMIFITFIVAAVTFGGGLIITWPACMIWGAVAASQYNQRMIIGPRY